MSAGAGNATSSWVISPVMSLTSFTMTSLPCRAHLVWFFVLVSTLLRLFVDNFFNFVETVISLPSIKAVSETFCVRAVELDCSR